MAGKISKQKSFKFDRCQLSVAPVHCTSRTVPIFDGKRFRIACSLYESVPATIEYQILASQCIFSDRSTNIFGVSVVGSKTLCRFELHYFSRITSRVTGPSEDALGLGFRGYGGLGLFDFFLLLFLSVLQRLCDLISYLFIGIGKILSDDFIAIWDRTP